MSIIPPSTWLETKEKAAFSHSPKIIHPLEQVLHPGDKQELLLGAHVLLPTQPAAQHHLHGSDVPCVPKQLEMARSMWDVSSDTARMHSHGASITFCFSINPPGLGLWFVPFAVSQPLGLVCQTRHKPSVLPLRAGRLITIFG